MECVGCAACVDACDEIMEKGVSNFEFHYLGSAKIMAQIGKGFAESMTDLLESHE